ncbi:MAG: cytochrome c biogenesis CcdA family protein [Nitrospiria bacterium]
MDQQSMSLGIAFGGGLLSFASPCVLPLVPSYLAYITGLSFEELSGNGVKSGSARRKSAIHSLTFILGFSTMFALLGASASTVGNWLLDYQDKIRIAGGVLVFFMGLFVTGWIRIPWLGQEKKLHFSRRPAGIFGTYLIGIVFAAGWTPCVGPILASILTLAATSEGTSSGVILLIAYSFGIGLPLFLSALAVQGFLKSYRRLQPYMGKMAQVTGILLMIVGGMLMSNSLILIGDLAVTWAG